MRLAQRCLDSLLLLLLLLLVAAEYIPNTPIRVLRTVSDVRQWTSDVCSSSSSSSPSPSSSSSSQDQGVALIPTMGALHVGHTDLIRQAALRGHNKIVVSIYVNPAQFGVSEDLDSYPKTWDGDCAVLSSLYPELQSTLGGSSSDLQMAVFAPTTSEMYPSGFPGQEPDSKGSFVTITPVGELLEGKTRPTFFRGVATVCMKLFNIVLPSRVFFGQKDVQQTVVIRKMVRDFCLPLDVAVVPTTREPSDGLALSSRNVYLGTRRRRTAPVLVTALRAAEAAYLEEGALAAADIVPAALRVILDVLDQQMRLSPREGVMFELDYISLADPDTMEELDEVDPTRGAILSGAIKMLPVYEAQEGEDLGHSGGPPVRLIDNIILPPRIQEQAGKEDDA
ncbi:Nucleotidylyl transferase [Cryphonectria parasitica EP155]|uniref:Pantoate--beta-alanine ligase n=1 Tax=Cryphonectria parasitica (strain ATCC 38755 / EP155) TaxID=660469 RepID=A0A9P5CQV8_CRYP1|nr:Nucleotidylyl transferase [Cryphonectria parasitica EP155]KAF3766877.1 Nucleotidylyl transferase [Cryphonectria parasitica EP155]